MREFAQAPSVLVFDDIVRVYFSTRPPSENGQYISYMAYVDLNRKNLFEIVDVAKEPVLPLGKPGTFDEFGTNPTSVIRVGNDIRVYYCGWTRCISVPYNAAIGVAVSDDGGLTFKKAGSGPVLPYSVDEPFVIGSPKIRYYNGTWHLWYGAGKKWVHDESKPEPVYTLRLATSADGFEWEKYGKEIMPCRLEENECQASPDVFYSGKKYHMFFSYRYNLGFKNRGKGYRMGYAYSHDGRTWVRDDTLAGIAVSDEGWDSESISYPHVFELDGGVYMLYQGNEIGRYGFGIAKLEGTL